MYISEIEEKNNMKVSKFLLDYKLMPSYTHKEQNQMLTCI